MSFVETTPAQRRPIYQDLESLLNPGFLTHSVSINGMRILLRSPSKSDLLVARLRSDHTKDQDWKLWCLSACTWMVNGISVLEDPYAVNLLHDTYAALPSSIIDKFFWSFLGLYNRLLRAAKGIESICFEGFSRSTWHASRGMPLCSETCTGIPGTGRLGLNAIQEVYTAFNVIEDQRLMNHQQWILTRAGISVHLDKKGWTKLHEQDKNSDQRLESDRQRVLDLFYYRSVGALTWEEDFTDLRGLASMKRKSVKDLQKEFYNWVSGDKDEHDMFIETHKRKIQVARDSLVQKQKERRERTQEALKGVSSRVRMVGYTQQQMQELLAKTHRPKGVTQIIDRTDAERLYARYIQEEASPGVLEVVEGKLVTHEKPTLQQQVASRKMGSEFLKDK